MSPKQLGAVLKTLREQRGWTQAQVAERAAITQGYLAKLENGDQENPSLDIVRRLARALKVPLRDLL